MATLRDVDAIALALPEAAKQLDLEGRPTYAVRGKWFAFHRKPRRDAPFDDVFVFSCDGLDAKELMLADPRGVFFTTPHWKGYAAVLAHIPDLKRLSRAELRDVLVDAWLARAPKRLAKQYLDATS